jgi:hypothetical protein
MPSYSPSTIDRIADINYGLRVDTPILPATGWGGIAVWPLFTLVGGRVLINQLVGEITTQLGAQATLLKYYFTPTGGAQIDLSAISLTASGLAVGTRILAAGTIGGATTFSGIGASMAQPIPYIIGMLGPVGVPPGGVIGIQSTTVALLTGAAKFSIWYVPLDEGAYLQSVS